MPDWFTQALQLERDGRISAALDILFQSLDEWLSAGRFADVDDFIRELVPADLSITMMIGVLSMTRPAPAEKLPSRQVFFERSWAEVESRGRDAEKLLGGLRGPGILKEKDQWLTRSSST